jgi:hypothetical protein
VRLQYPASYKLRILSEYERLDREGKGALLRREGLYTSLLSEWRKQRDRGALATLGKPSGRRQSTPSSETTSGCAGGSSGWRPSWARPAR